MKKAKSIYMLVATACGLSSCAGTVGAIRSRTWQGEGTNITEIRSYGLQVRNIPGYYSLSLGHHRTIYANRAPEAHPNDPSESTWNYVYCKAPSEAPIFLQETIYGGEAASSRIFLGLSCGFTSRTAAVLSLHQDEAMSVTPHRKHQPSITYFTLQPHHEL